ncbi:MAG: flagellin [Candidatus Eisenbacteria bacterium]|nr:flagellin [Candidatus Eisenbacteria bacterium]
MAGSDLSRIRSNIQGLNILSTLRDVNQSVATHQLRLGTGKRINSAGDDPAGLSISNKLDARNRILQAVYDNIGQAKNMLAVGEGGLLSINDILVGMGEKIVTAATDSLGTEERQAISQELEQMVQEIDDIATQTNFNGVSMLNSNGTLKFQTAEGDQTEYSLSSFTPTALAMTNLASLTGQSVIDSSNYENYLNEVNAAITTINQGLTTVGSLMNRLTLKENNISIAQTNTESAFSRIRNADMAKEQLELTKAQILQQTSTAMLAQANLNGQGILSLFG